MESVKYRILGFLLTGAFFNCNESKSSKKRLTRKATSSDDSNISYGLNAARKIQETCSNDVNLSYPIRRMMSSRFFSVLSEFITSIPNHRISSKMTKEIGEANQLKASSRSEIVLETLAFVLQQCEDLQLNEFQRYVQIGEDDGDQDDMEEDENDLTMEEVEKQMHQFKKLSRELLKNNDTSSEKESSGKNKPVIGCTILMLSLYVQLLRCGSDESEENGIQDDDEQEEEEEAEGINELIKDLVHATNSIIDNFDGNSNDSSKNSEKKDEINPLALLADICVSTLSLFEKTGVSSRSTKMLRETVRMAWAGTLMAVTSTESSLVVDENVTEIILEAICVNDVISNNKDNDDDDVDMEDASNGSEDDDAEAFNKAMKHGLDVDGEDVDTESKGSKDVSDEELIEKDDSDVELDPEQLQNLLLEDAIEGDEDEDNGFQLEHHEGADAALAQMIKLRQDSRKQAQEEKDRVEYAHRIRCLILLECLFPAHGTNKNCSIFDNENLVLLMLQPILRMRRKLEKSITHEKISRKNGAASEKKALLEKLTPIFKNKICKTKFLATTKHEGLESLALGILSEANNSLSIAHCACCSSALLLIVQVSEDFDEKCTLVRSVYGKIAEEWSTRKATKLNVVFFDDVTTRFLDISRIVMAPFFANAAQNGRSAYIKSEAFRLLSCLYNFPLLSSSQEKSRKDETLSALRESAVETLSAINDAYQDEEFTKAKRIRDVLKVSERLASFSIEQSEPHDLRCQLSESLSALSKNLSHLSTKSQSDNVKKSCGKIIELITDFVKKVSTEKDTVNQKSVQCDIKKGKESKTKKKKKKSKGKKSKK